MSSGSLTRGAFYFGVESLAGWMLFKTARRLGVARDQAGLWEDRVTARLMSEGISDPMEIEAALGEHEEVARFGGWSMPGRSSGKTGWPLPSSPSSSPESMRSCQHTFRDFPEPLTIEGDPADGRIEVGFRVPTR